MTRQEKSRVEAIDIVLIDEFTVTETEHWVSGCEHCVENATIRLAFLLDALIGNEPQLTEYLMSRAARCPACSSKITEHTLITV
jgi:hypothetical protein